MNYINSSSRMDGRRPDCVKDKFLRCVCVKLNKADVAIKTT